MTNAFNDVHVVGMHFREREGVPAKQIVASFVPPVVCQLERQYDNAFDEYAIKVLYGGQHIGFLAASSACFIAPEMDLDPDTPWTATVESFHTAKSNLYPVATVAPALPE